MIKSIGIVAASMGLAFACGDGDGGPDDDATFASLSDAELVDECEILIELFPARMLDCDGASTLVGFENIAQCTGSTPNKPGCTFTVSEAEDCFEALGDRSDAEVCAQVQPSACDALSEVPCP